MSKNLRYFMREEARTEQTITVPGPGSIKDENGNVVPLEIKILSAKRIREINEAYHEVSVVYDKKGNPVVNNGLVVLRNERDSARATRHIIAEALVDPDLKDPEIMKFFGCADITDMPEKVFPRADEYSHVVRAVMDAIGLGGALDDEDKELEDAKN